MTGLAGSGEAEAAARAALREHTATELRQIVEAGVAGFPAAAWVWRALESPGKLLSGRSGFCWGLLPPLVCEAAGGDGRLAVPVGAALECLVAAADAIDDVQDQDAPDALWRACGLATATNVVVYLLFLYQLALGRLADLGLAGDRLASLLLDFARAGTRACAGQQRDLDWLAGELPSEDDYLAAIAWKSASAVECACRAGGVLASASPDVVAACAAFGFNLGMALQIRNDLAAASSARASRDDLWAGRATLPVLFALECSPLDSRGEIADLLRRARSRRLGPEEVDRLASLLASTRALDYAAVVADVYTERALGHLRGFAAGREQPLVDLLREMPNA